MPSSASKITLLSIVALTALACATPAHAFKLQAFGSTGPAQIIGGASPQAQAFMRHFTVDVHERITRQAYEKAGIALPEDVLAGVRWNDNPPATRIVGALFGNCGGPLCRTPTPWRRAWAAMPSRRR